MLSAEEQAIRRTGIGASEIAAVCGLSPFQTSLDVYARKLNLLDDAGNEATWAGHFLEEAVAQMYRAKNNDVELRKGTTVAHPKYPWVLATPDRYVLDSSGEVSHLLEIKTSQHRRGWGSEIDEIPEHYLCQVTWQMAVTGIARADVAVLIAGLEYKQYQISFDEELFGMLLDKANEFWHENVLKQNSPAIDESDGCRRVLEERFKELNKEVVPAPETAEEWVKLYDEALRSEKSAAEAKALAQNHLCKLIGELGVRGIRSPAWTVTWSASDKGRVSWKDVAEHLKPTPEILKKFSSPAPRVLRVTRKDSQE